MSPRGVSDSDRIVLIVVALVACVAAVAIVAVVDAAGIAVYWHCCHC